jgi:hypothetical protein
MKPVRSFAPSKEHVFGKNSWNVAETIRCIVEDPDSTGEYLDNYGYSRVYGFPTIPVTKSIPGHYILSVIASKFINGPNYALLKPLTPADRSRVVDIITEHVGGKTTDGIVMTLLKEAVASTKEIEELRAVIAEQRKQLEKLK